MAAADSGIDPRYAAQFQRGFDPARHVAEPLPERRGPVRLEGGAPPVVHRVPDPPRIVERQVAAPRPEEHAPVEAAPPEDDREPARRPRTEWALLGAGILLLLIAATTFQKSAEIAMSYQGYGSSLEDQAFALVVQQLPGPLLVAGTVAVCLWMVLRAVRAPRDPA